MFLLLFCECSVLGKPQSSIVIVEDDYNILSLVSAFLSWVCKSHILRLCGRQSYSSLLLGIPCDWRSIELEYVCITSCMTFCCLRSCFSLHQCSDECVLSFLCKAAQHLQRKHFSKATTANSHTETVLCSWKLVHWIVSSPQRVKNYIP